MFRSLFRNGGFRRRSHQSDYSGGEGCQGVFTKRKRGHAARSAAESAEGEKVDRDGDGDGEEGEADPEAFDEEVLGDANA